MTEAPIFSQRSWISVKDRLPDSGKHVLVACEGLLITGRRKYYYACEAIYAAPKTVIASEYEDIDGVYDEETDGYYLPEGWWGVVYNCEYIYFIDDFVTHWMPLPEPPEEKDND